MIFTYSICENLEKKIENVSSTNRYQIKSLSHTESYQICITLWMKVVITIVEKTMKFNETKDEN